MSAPQQRASGTHGTRVRLPRKCGAKALPGSRPRSRRCQGRGALQCLRCRSGAPEARAPPETPRWGVPQGLRASEAHRRLLSRGGWARGCRLPPGPAGGQRGGPALGVLLTCGPVASAARAQGRDGQAGSSLRWCRGPGQGCGQTARISTAFRPAGLSAPFSRSDLSQVRTVILALAGSSAG